MDVSDGGIYRLFIQSFLVQDHIRFNGATAFLTVRDAGAV